MAARLARPGVALATAGLALLGLGMGTGNVELLALAAFPLLLLAAPLAARAQGEVKGARTLSTRTPRRGDVVEVEMRVDVPPGSGLVEVHAPMPDGFSLEAGTNLAMRAQPGAWGTRFRARAHQRGSHAVPPLVVERIDPHGLLAPRTRTLGEEERVEVAPRSHGAGALRRRGRARARASLPDLENARLGMGSTDFRELRDYAWGDPPKSINWKASARRLSAQAGQGRASAPLVNEYEKEGRRTTLVLLDGGADLRVGTSLETGLDHAVEAALSAVKLLLARGARVGGATFHARAPPATPPDAGAGQLRGLERSLSPGDPEPDVTPVHALQTLEPHVVGARPHLLVVTRVTPRTLAPLTELVRRVRLTQRERRDALPVTIVDVRALDLAPAPTPVWEAARALAELEDADAARQLAAAGARVVPWRPRSEDFRAALVRRGLL